MEVRLEYPAPDGMTDPADIAEWEAQREAFAEAYDKVRLEQQMRERRAALARYAADAAELDAERLARDLAENLTPPLVAAFASRDSCGGIHGPPVLDPQGYSCIAGFEAMALERGVFEDSKDAKFIPRRLVRGLTRRKASDEVGGCLGEARAAVAVGLLRRFSWEELAHAMTIIRANAYDRVPDDNLPPHYRISGTGDHRLLAFVEGREGPLRFNDSALPNDIYLGDKVRYALLNEQRSTMKAFFAEDAVGRAMLLEVERVVADGTAACPVAMAEQEAFWNEVRDLTLKNKAERFERRRARAGSPTS
ncbi:hypothetical protein K3148_09575 [Qipengyuania aurantiaca]|uniref:Uncharacterized protein n=1 Tax=Qipengyuania aurantiaca TaxID=2867233 RepID=A0ABX8ZJB3_9SPHN|nr:hypothetical protein [Qipengyuania aurantiaca]QZD89085.1 hypothetical protein K3148_09575 [Qipengyuania aurantiaca]